MNHTAEPYSYTITVFAGLAGLGQRGGSHNSSSMQAAESDPSCWDQLPTILTLLHSLGNTS